MVLAPAKVAVGIEKAANKVKGLSGGDIGAPCPICRGPRHPLFRKRLLGRHEVDYYYCHGCGLLQTEEPYWLEEAYSDAIADADTGLLARNQRLARKCASLFYFLFSRSGPYIDSAGGYGVFTRLMRDIGFDCYWYDKYCENLFARGFDASLLQQGCEAVTAFEVLEHIQDPLDFIRSQMQAYDSSTLILSTELYGDVPPRDWWYYTTETGQHVSFYQSRTLARIANELSLHLYSFGNLHIFTSKPLNRFFARILSGHLSFLSIMWVKYRMRSLTFSDYEKVAGNTPITVKESEGNNESRL